MGGVLNIRKLAPGSSRHALKLTAPELELESSDIVDVIDCKVSLDVDFHTGEIVVRGKAESVLKLECARCLEPFEHRMVHNLAFVIKLARKGELNGPECESSDDFFVVSDAVEGFEIAPIVRERILLSLPLKPLCDESCKGLCPQCGVNKNTETCNCTTDRTDERWSGLMELKQRYGGN
jgi:uncharacterized protein